MIVLNAEVFLLIQTFLLVVLILLSSLLLMEITQDAVEWIFLTIAPVTAALATSSFPSLRTAQVAAVFLTMQETLLAATERPSVLGHMVSTQNVVEQQLLIENYLAVAQEIRL